MFGEGVEEIRGIPWDWANFQSTEGFPISEQLFDWVIGQSEAVDKTELAVDQWIYKLLWMQREGLLERGSLKTTKTWEKMPPGPFILMLGDPGTGKTLLGRAIAEKMTAVYEENNIQLTDIVCHLNEVIPSEPRITVHPTPQGKDLVRIGKIKAAAKEKWSKQFWSTLLYWIVGLGVFLLVLGLIAVIYGLQDWIYNVPMTVQGMTRPTREWYLLWYGKRALMTYLQYLFVGPLVQGLLIAGSTMTVLPMLILFVRGMAGGGKFNVGGTQRTMAPKILVDNSKGGVPFIEATGHRSTQLYGSLVWDPYQQYSEDTLVLTIDGWKLIGDINEGDSVLTLNNNLVAVYYQVLLQKEWFH